MQKVCKDEEFDTFITYMKTDLPATFRITGSKGEAKKMLGIVQDQFINCTDQSKPDSKPLAVFPLPW